MMMATLFVTGTILPTKIAKESSTQALLHIWISCAWPVCSTIQLHSDSLLLVVHWLTECCQEKKKFF